MHCNESGGHRNTGGVTSVAGIQQWGGRPPPELWGLCVCVCVCARVRACVRACAYKRTRVLPRACVYVRARVYVYARTHVLSTLRMLNQQLK